MSLKKNIFIKQGKFRVCPRRGTHGSWDHQCACSPSDLCRNPAWSGCRDWGLWTDGCWSEMQEAFLNPIKSVCNFSGTGHSLLSLFWNMVSFLAFPPECPMSAHPKMSSPQNASFYIGISFSPPDFFWHFLLIFLSFFQMKLLNLYIKRAQTTNSNSSSSSDVSTHS